jgi:hypothetical protein
MQIHPGIAPAIPIPEALLFAHQLRHINLVYYTQLDVESHYVGDDNLTISLL